MMTARKWILLLLTGLGWSATLDAQILGLGRGGNTNGEAGNVLTSPGGALPGETLPVNIDPFADVPAEARVNEPLIGLENVGADGSYDIEVGDTPDMIIKQHSLNPLIDLREEAPASSLDENGLPVIELP